MKELTTKLSYALDSIKLDINTFINYSAISYGLGEEEDIFYITYFSSADTSHRYISYPIDVNIKTGELVKLCSTKVGEESKIYMLMEDKNAIETMFQQLFALLDVIGGQHLWYFRCSSKSPREKSHFDFQMAFKYKRQYYILIYETGEVPITNINILDNWYLTKSKNTPPHR